MPVAKPLKFEIDVSAKPVVKLAHVVSAMSAALDITEGQPVGHAARSCLIAMRIADEIGLDDSAKSDLFYGTLIKDAGCSSNAAKMCSLFGADDRSLKRDVKTIDWTRPSEGLQFFATQVGDRTLVGKLKRIVSLSLNANKNGNDLIQTRCSRGAQIARKFGFSEGAAKLIESLDEHWDGKGEPCKLQGEQIPLLARIACLVQTVEVFLREFGLKEALEVANRRSGKWFDPKLVAAINSFKNDTTFWENVRSGVIDEKLWSQEPECRQLTADDNRLDAIAEGFADVVDAKSPWTYHHSEGVADAFVGTLEMLGYSQFERRYWRRAALLHDIGKLGVSNLILDKPGKLTEQEFSDMKQHAEYTQRILSCVPGFQEFADIAAAHHEKLDGSGYFLGLKAEQLTLEARVLVVADIYDALSAKRPYRKKQLTQQKVLEIMSEDVGPKLCPIAFEALTAHVESKS